MSKKILSCIAAARIIPEYSYTSKLKCYQNKYQYSFDTIWPLLHYHFLKKVWLKFFNDNLEDHAQWQK